METYNRDRHVMDLIDLMTKEGAVVTSVTESQYVLTLATGERITIDDTIDTEHWSAPVDDLYLCDDVQESEDEVYMIFQACRHVYLRLTLVIKA